MSALTHARQTLETNGDRIVQQQQARSALGFLRVIAFLGEFGLSRPLIATIPDKMMPPAAVPVYESHPGSYEIVFQHKFFYAMYGEAQAMETSDAQVAAVGSMGDTPLIVIRHGKPMPSGTEETEQKWQAFQEEIARQSSAGRIIVAEASGHSIQLEQPAIIVEAVQQLLKSPLVETVNGQLTQQFNTEVKQLE